MSDEIKLGRKVGDLDVSEPSMTISRVIVIRDSETEFSAGDDTGRTLEVTNPWGSQKMAESILARVKDYVYKPYTAKDAILDPAAEIGDFVTVNGVYSVIADIDTEMNSLCPATIKAPKSDEIDDEYPYTSFSNRLIERQLKYNRSLISKTAEAITLRVEDVEEGFAQLKLTVDGVTITDEDGTTLIKGSSIETDSLVLSGSIKFIGTSGTETTLQGAISAASTTLPSYIKSTYIDGTSVTAPVLRGGIVSGAKFSNLAQTSWLEVGKDTDGIDNDAFSMVLFNNRNGDDSSIFGVYDGDFGYTSFSGKLDHSFLTVDALEATTYPKGTWDFSDANVTGLNAYLTFS